MPTNYELRIEAPDPGNTLPAATGSYAYAGGAATLTADQPSRVLPAVAGAYPYSGKAASLSQPGTGAAPGIFTRFIDFESHAHGSDGWGSGDDRFDWIGNQANGTTLIDNTRAFRGTRSAKLNVSPAGGSAVSFGGGPGINTGSVAHGSEFWIQLRVYLGTDWHETGVPGSQKFVRMARTSDSKFNDLRMKPSVYNCTTGSRSMFVQNQKGGASWQLGNLEGPLHPTNGNEILNSWNTYEWYIKPGDTVGNAETVVWRDHIPMEGEIVTSGPVCTDYGYFIPLHTLNSGSDSLKGSIHFFGQWNAPGPNDDVTLWIDCIAIAKDGVIPEKTCPVTGYKFFGDWEND